MPTHRSMNRADSLSASATLGTRGRSATDSSSRDRKQTDLHGDLESVAGRSWAHLDRGPVEGVVETGPHHLGGDPPRGHRVAVAEAAGQPTSESSMVGSGSQFRWIETGSAREFERFGQFPVAVDACGGDDQCSPSWSQHPRGSRTPEIVPDQRSRSSSMDASQPLHPIRRRRTGR